MMRKIALLFLLSLLAFSAGATTFNANYTLSDLTTRPSSVIKVTMTPLQPFVNYEGTILDSRDVVRVTSTNGTCTFSNVVAGYDYRLTVFLTGGSSPSFTNGFPEGLEGEVNGADYLGVRVGQIFYFAGATNGSVSVSGKVSKTGDTMTGGLYNYSTTGFVGNGTGLTNTTAAAVQSSSPSTTLLLTPGAGLQLSGDSDGYFKTNGVDFYNGALDSFFGLGVSQVTSNNGNDLSKMTPTYIYSRNAAGQQSTITPNSITIAGVPVMQSNQVVSAISAATNTLVNVTTLNSSSNSLVTQISAKAGTNVVTGTSNGVLSNYRFTDINMRSFPVNPPRMFYETWPLLNTNISETNILQVATNIVTRAGYTNVGWNSILIDEPWLGGHDANGVFYANSNTFPSGVDSLISNIHSLGLEVGFFFTLGTNGVSGPGSIDYIEQDATNAVSKGVDFVFLVVDDNGYANPSENYNRYRRFIKTVRELGSNMEIMGTVHGFEPWLVDEVGGGQLWVYPNYVDGFSSYANLFDLVDSFSDQSWRIRPGHYLMHGWLGAMVETNGTLSLPGFRSEYGMLSMFHSPLSMGNTYDGSESPNWKTVHTNSTLMSILRDSAINPPTLVLSNSGIQVWTEDLKDQLLGTKAIALLNRNYTVTNTITFTWESIGMNAGVYLVKDVWSGSYSVVSSNSLSVTVQPYDTALYIVSPWDAKYSSINSTVYSSTAQSSTVIGGAVIYSIPIAAADSSFLSRIPIGALASGKGTNVIVNCSFLLTNTTPWKLQPVISAYHSDGTFANVFVSGINVSGTNAAGIFNFTSAFQVPSNTVGGFFQLAGIGTNTSTMHWLDVTSLRK